MAKKEEEEEEVEGRRKKKKKKQQTQQDTQNPKTPTCVYSKKKTKEDRGVAGRRKYNEEKFKIAFARYKLAIYLRQSQIAVVIPTAHSTAQPQPAQPAQHCFAKNKKMGLKEFRNSFFFHFSSAHSFYPPPLLFFFFFFFSLIPCRYINFKIR